MITIKAKTKTTFFGIALLLPSLAVLALLFVTPLVNMLATSFTNQNLLRPDRLDFIAFENYIWMFTDSIFWETLGRTLIFTASVTVISIVVSMLLSLLLNMEFPGKRIVFALLLLPWVTSFMSSAFIFTLLYDFSFGVFNYLLSFLGIGPQVWLGQLNTALGSVILVSVWHFLPFSILVLTNALKQVPEELLESARLDGAGGWRAFFAITIPVIKPALITLTIVRIAASFRAFDSIFLLTRGGPGTATTTLPLWYHQIGFQSFRAGRGASVGVIMVLVVLLIYFTLIKTYGDEAV